MVAFLHYLREDSDIFISVDGSEVPRWSVNFDLFNSGRK